MLVRVAFKIVPSKDEMELLNIPESDVDPLREGTVGSTVGKGIGS